MGKLGQAIAKDLLKAQNAHVEDEEFNQLQFEDDLTDALETLLDEEEDDEDGDFDDEDDESEEEYLTSDYELYLTIFEYPMALGAFLLNCEELLEKYPELRQHRMFLMGGFLDCQPDSPSSTVSRSYHNFWSFFDALVAHSQETLATIVRETAQSDEADDAIQLLNVGIDSRMSFYIHRGYDEKGIKLEEIGNPQPIYVNSPAPYDGEVGEVWFVRVLPPLEDSVRHTIVTTPYIFKQNHREACEELIQKAGSIDGKWNVADVTSFMKYGPTPSYWLDYLQSVPSLIDHNAGVIYLKEPPLFPAD